MNKKYILSSLCSNPPYIYNNGKIKYGLYNIVPYNNGIILTSLNVTNQHTIQKYVDLTTSLNIDIKNKKLYRNNFKKNKKNLCIFTLAKINHIINIFTQHKNYIGLSLLQNSKKIQRYNNYSDYLLDYEDNYSYTHLYDILYKINKIISQNITCIKQNNISTFKLILNMLLNLDIEDNIKQQISIISQNDHILLKIFYKYINNLNYYIEIGELFKNV